MNENCWHYYTCFSSDNTIARHCITNQHFYLCIDCCHILSDWGNNHKKILSKNQEDKIKCAQEFYKKEKEIYDMFLGEGGVDKILHGRKLEWNTFNEIDEIISEYIAPKLEFNIDNMTNKLKEKYKIETEEENVLE